MAGIVVKIEYVIYTDYEKIAVFYSGFWLFYCFILNMGL